MSLERKDIRAKLSAERHAQLHAICDVDGVDMGDFIESLLVPVIDKRIHDAIALVSRLQHPGISGHARECHGTSGSARE